MFLQIKSCQKGQQEFNKSQFTKSRISNANGIRKKIIFPRRGPGGHANVANWAKRRLGKGGLLGAEPGQMAAVEMGGLV